MDTITIEVKTVYGIIKVYPVCEKAKIFAEIAGTTTLTHNTLCKIERLGYKIIPTANTNYKEVSDSHYESIGDKLKTML